MNGSSQNFSNLPGADGTLQSLAVDTSNHTLYFLTLPTTSSGGVTLYSYSLIGNSAGAFTAIWTDTNHHIDLGGTPTLTVDPLTGQYYITADDPNSSTGDAVYVGSLTLVRAIRLSSKALARRVICRPL